MATAEGDDSVDICEGFYVAQKGGDLGGKESDPFVDLVAVRQCQSDHDLVEQHGDEDGSTRHFAVEDGAPRVILEHLQDQSARLAEIVVDLEN